MKILKAKEEEIHALRVWAGDIEAFSEEQVSLCLALERLGGNAMPAEIAQYLETTEDRIREAKKGIFWILVDASTGRFWIK